MRDCSKKQSESIVQQSPNLRSNTDEEDAEIQTSVNNTIKNGFDVSAKGIQNKEKCAKEKITEPTCFTELLIKDLSRLERKYRNTFRVSKYGAMPRTRDNKELLQYLRSHTRQGYLNFPFDTVFGKQPLRGRELDAPGSSEESLLPTATLAGEPIDFGHMIASLSGQFGGSEVSGVGASIPFYLGAGVSWSGDLGTVVINEVN